MRPTLTWRGTSSRREPAASLGAGRSGPPRSRFSTVLRLTLITARARAADTPLVELVTAAARAGVDRIQLREKDLDDRSLVALTRAICAAVSPFRPRVFVNGRPDVALACGADGVQLPEAGLPVQSVKRAFAGLEIGASRHDLAGAVAAEAAGADFVVLGPVFPTVGKAERVLGVDALATATERLGIPVDAVGGVTPANAGQVRRAGAAGAAAIGAFLVGDLEATVAAFRRAE